MMAPTDAQRIEHILEAIETIQERVADLDESAFIHCREGNHRVEGGRTNRRGK